MQSPLGVPVRSRVLATLLLLAPLTAFAGQPDTASAPQNQSPSLEQGEPYFRKLRELPDFAALRANWIRSDLGGDNQPPREAALELWLAHEFLDQTSFRTPIVIEYFTPEDLPSAQKLRAYLIGSSAGGMSARGRTRSGNENRVLLLETSKKSSWAGWVIVRSEDTELPRKPTREMARIFKALEWDMGTRAGQLSWDADLQAGTSVDKSEMDSAPAQRRGWENLEVFAGLETGMRRSPKLFAGDSLSAGEMLASAPSASPVSGSVFTGDSLKTSQSAVKKDALTSTSVGVASGPGRPKRSGMSFRPEYRTEVLSVDRTTGGELKDLDARAGWVGGRVGADWALFQRPVVELGIHGDYGMSYRAITESAKNGEAQSWNFWAYSTVRANTSKFGVPSLRLGMGRFGNTRTSQNPEVVFLPKMEGWLGNATVSLRIDQHFSLDLSGSIARPTLAASRLFDIGGAVRQRFYESQGRSLDGRFGFQISAAEFDGSPELSPSQETWSNVYFGLVAEI